MTFSAAFFLEAQEHLQCRDRVLERVIRDVGPCTLRPNRDRFGVLVRSILAQQISTRAAAAIHGRLREALAPEGIRAERVVRTPETILRSVGLSQSKARALHDLAEKVMSGSVPLDRTHRWSDEEVIDALVTVRGIGRWTAEMFLIFSLRRPDILPVSDWGLRVGVQRRYGLAEPPGRIELEKLAEPWQPYRSIATWYFWRSLGFVPQSQVKAPTAAAVCRASTSSPRRARKPRRGRAAGETPR